MLKLNFNIVTLFHDCYLLRSIIKFPLDLFIFNHNVDIVILNSLSSCMFYLGTW